MSESTRIFADNYRKSLTRNTGRAITVQVSLPVVYQTLIQLGLKVKIVKFEKNEIEISLEEALSADQEEVNLELQILNLAESNVTHKTWNDLIEGWDGEIELN